MGKAMITIRKEKTEDYDAIDHVNRSAFGKEDAVGIVHRVREDGGMIVSLVAEDEEKIVGHILISEADFETTKGASKIAAIGPLVVLPEYQGKGVGSQLMHVGLEETKMRGYGIVVLLGHPKYYVRFGFSPELGAKVTSKYSSKGPAWMALELKGGALDICGTARYHSAFG